MPTYWRIKDIAISNLKFFKEEETLHLEGKNMLIYGENGSGKSSIYWAIYTHFQAWAKTKDEATKYFNPSHPQNIRNRFCEAKDKSSIKITFQAPGQLDKTIEDSLSACYIDDAEQKEFMRLSMLASDFLTYGFLSSLFEFSNSQVNEVFDIFAKHIFDYIEIPSLGRYTKSNSTATFWWNWLRTSYDLLPFNKTGTYRIGNVHHRRYQYILHSFNKRLKDALNDIQDNANALLADLDVGATIALKYEPGVAGRRSVPTSKYYSNKYFKKPGIVIEAKLTNPAIADKDIKHPRTYFNEAKITCMSLALRLAVLKTRPPLVNSAPVLLIDDLLISLDMVYRRQVVEKLLSYSNQYQLLIFTHDRSLFKLYQRTIESNHAANQWKVYEIYSDSTPYGSKPSIYESQSHLERAKKYFKAHDLLAAGNAVRSACEAQIKRLAPLSLILNHSAGPDDDPYLTLRGMIDKFEPYMDSFGLKHLVKDIDHDRYFIYNPASHDDTDTNFYRTEIEKAINALEELSRIEKFQIIPDADIRQKEYQMTVAKGIHSYIITFVFTERFPKLVYQGINYYSQNTLAIIKSIQKVNADRDLKANPGGEYSLSHILRSACDRLSIKADDRPDLLSTITPLLG